MSEGAWPDGPILPVKPRSPIRPKSRIYTRLSQAHAALGIKDDETGTESEIDKRLGLGVKSRSPIERPFHSIAVGSTCSSTASSNYRDHPGSSNHGSSNHGASSSTDGGSIYGGVVLRPTSHSLPRPPSVHTKDYPNTKVNVSELETGDGSDQEGSGVGGLQTPGTGLQRSDSLPPPKPARKKLSSTQEPPEPRTPTFTRHKVKTPAMMRGKVNWESPISTPGETKTSRELSTPTPGGGEDKKSKRKRYSSADFLTKSLVQGKEDRADKKEKNKLLEPKRRNRLSSLYNSMRTSKNKNKDDSSGSDRASTADNPDNKALRLLEEETCLDPKKLLQDRVRELRKVADPGNVPKPLDDREDFPLFEFVCEVSMRRKSENFCPYISWSHPPLRVLEEEQERLASINSLPMFCFPDMDLVEQVKKMKTETYCFVFTDLQAQNKFGYCRRFLPAPKNNPPEKRFPVVYCMVTKLRSFETFSKIFDQVVELRDFSSAGAYSFLKSLIEQNAPKPGRGITVKYINAKVGNLVDIRVERVTAGKRFEHVDLVHVLTKLGSKLLVEIFINLLVERKLLFVAECLNDLTTIIHSIMQLLYPLHWQGIYIPVLPQEIIDATSSPVPFVIGILKQHSKIMDEEALDDECNIVYITDKRIVKRPNFTDIPFNKKYRKKFLQELKTYKGKVAKLERSPEQTVEIGDMFFEFTRTCIGHYADHVTFDETGESDIDLTSFSDSAGLHAEFVWQLSKTQMFSSFVQALSPDSLTSSNPFNKDGAG